MKNETLLNPRYLLLPVLLGLGVIGWLFAKECDVATFSSIRLSGKMGAGIALAVLCMLCQNFALTARYRMMAGGRLSWRQSFRVNVLCEFTSAATPSSVGGASLIPLYLHKEGLNGGEGTAVMISCLFLDELFLAVSCVAILLLFPLSVLIKGMVLPVEGIQVLFMLVLLAVALWTLVLYVALFHKAVWIKKMLLAMFSLPLLRRWKGNVESLGNDLVESSKEMSNKSPRFWLSCFGMTAVAWCARFLVVNALVFAFSDGEFQIVAFAMQFVLWMLMMISPTPGGSGFSEYMFGVYYADFFTANGVVVVVALVWRIITYYSYLIAGACVLPYWLNMKRRRS